MQNLLLALILISAPPADFTRSVYNVNFDIGSLGPDREQGYGNDDVCWVSIRPLYSGEEEGLPLYKIFDKELYDLTGYEFRRPYYTNLYKLLECGCTAPQSTQWEGYSIMLNQNQQTEYDLFFRTVDKDN